jgi:hypothetical protein
MTLKITPDECRVLERGLHVSTRCPKDAIDDAMIAVRALQAVLANGDEIIVQCTTHDRNTVLHQRRWLVYSKTTANAVDESNERSPRSYEKITYDVLPLGDWLTTPAGKADEAQRAETAKEAAKAEKPKKAA